MEEDENNALVVQGEESTYNPLDHLCTRAQKIANLKNLTALTDNQIAQRLRMSTKDYKAITEDIHFGNYLKQLQHRFDQEGFGDLVKRQERHLRDVMFQEVAARFEIPDPDNDLPELATETERKAYLRRFASESSFKDLMTIWNQINKSLGDVDQGSNVGGDETELVRRVQEKRVKLISRRQKLHELISEKGGDYNELMTVQPEMDFSSGGRSASQDFEAVEEVTVTMEEFSIKGKS
jgi:hypothetical protein